VRRTPLIAAAICSTLPFAAAADGRPETALHFDWLWTHSHVTPDQISEIPAFDQRTNTIWVAGVVGVDVLDARTGELLEHIDVTPHGSVNSVAIHNGLAAFAVEATGDRRNPGKVLFYDTRTRDPSPWVSEIEVGSLPDMLTFTHDGRRLLVANEGTPNPAADEDYELGPGIDPPGTVSIIDMNRRQLIANAGLEAAPQLGTHLRTSATVGMDFEPEYIAVDETGTRAYVTLQEANGIGVLDLRYNMFTEIVGLGAKDFNAPGNEIDPWDNASILFGNHAARGFYMPDSIALHRWRGRLYTVTANEGDFREDDGDRSAASSFGAVAPLARLRVSNVDSSTGNLFAAGARSFSIRDAFGNLVYDSGDILDKAAAAAGLYNDGRSRDKGVEPEGLSLLDIAGRTYAFVGLERTLQSAVAVFDITNPYEVEYLDLLVSLGEISPEGIAAYQYRGQHYLAVAHEVSNTTTLYRIRRELRRDW
jgi:hypothetical protein